MKSGAHNAGGRYEWLGWSIPASASDNRIDHKLAEIHERQHDHLDQLSAFGALLKSAAALAHADPASRWPGVRDRLKDMADVVHETYAVATSLLLVRRRLEPIDGYPQYDRYVDIAWQLVGEETHPWVARTAVQAAAHTCMQSNVLGFVLRDGLENFDPVELPTSARPNHRLVALLQHGYLKAVAKADAEAYWVHGEEDWWETRVAEPPDEGVAFALNERLHLAAAECLRQANAPVIFDGRHLASLAALEAQVQAIASRPLPPTRVVATFPATGPAAWYVDEVAISLPETPERARLVPYVPGSGVCAGPTRIGHRFLTVMRPEYLAASYEMSGMPVPDAPAIACLRTRFEDEQHGRGVQYLLVDPEEPLDDGGPPLYVSITSSAVVEALPECERWMRHTPPDRLSLIMDTPVSPTLREWCKKEGSLFRSVGERVVVPGSTLCVIYGRIGQPDTKSPLVIIPTTELAATMFGKEVEEDELLRDRVVWDRLLLEEEREHIALVLAHLFYEDRVIGPGRWR